MISTFNSALKTLAIHRRRIALSALFLSGIATGSWAACPQMGDSNWTVAVLKFQTNGALEPMIAQSLPEMLSTGLVQQSRARVVERSQVGQASQALKIEQLSLNAKQRLEMGQWLGAKGLILGNVVQLGRRLRLDVRLVDVQSGEMICAASTSGESQSIEGLLGNILVQMRPTELNLGRAEDVLMLPSQPQSASLSPADSGIFELRVKSVNSLFNEKPIPVQKVRVWVNDSLVAETEAFGQINTEMRVLQIKRPTGTNLLRFEFGSVNAKRQWNRALLDQPGPRNVLISKDRTANIRCLQVFSESEVRYQCE
jgi:TolB-like protein